MVATPPRSNLIEGLAARLAVTSNARGTKVEASGMELIDLDQTYLLVGIPLADLDPGQGLRERQRNRLGWVHHRSILAHIVILSSFGACRGPARASADAPLSCEGIRTVSQASLVKARVTSTSAR